ncbi:MAG: DUF4860 domain-containing protein [Dorea sp.]|jgi:hypothetical protein|nr:DUF4860 domain-containing protein [Dorea sp.]
MRFRVKQRHMIDFLFPVALFFVFALSALTVILLATKIYQSTTENSSLNYTSRTSLSYISEKIHQQDSGKISLGTFSGCDALVLDQDMNGTAYHTYIYAYQNELKEIFLKDGARANASAGQTILKVQNFSMEQVSDSLFSFQCTDETGQTARSLISVRSTVF